MSQPKSELTTSGDMVLLHHSPGDSGQPGPSTYHPSAFLLSAQDRGHHDVVRCLYHDVRNEAVYTGSEDGVLSGWSLPDLGRLRVGDPDVDDLDDEEVGDDDDSEESEIESAEESDDTDMEVEKPEPRGGSVLGGGTPKKRRRS